MKIMDEMLILVSGSTNLIRHFGPARLGGLVTPSYQGMASNYLKMGAAFAMDNECFGGLRRGAVIKMLRKHQPWAKDSLWTVVPDVVGNAKATLARFNEWEPVVRSYGYKPAFVLQNGVEEIVTPWDRFDCLFIGGDTEFKIGPIAERYTKEAKERGKWVHMGRCSSRRRMYIAGQWGVDSIDSVGFSRFGRRDLVWALPIATFYSAANNSGKVA